MGPWVARGEKNNVKKVKLIISDSDVFRGLCAGDRPQVKNSLDGVPTTKNAMGPPRCAQGLINLDSKCTESVGWI